MVGKITYKPSDSPDSLEVFRNQEIDRYNVLIATMSKTLIELKKAI